MFKYVAEFRNLHSDSSERLASITKKTIVKNPPTPNPAMLSLKPNPTNKQPPCRITMICADLSFASSARAGVASVPSVKYT